MSDSCSAVLVKCDDICRDGSDGWEFGRGVTRARVSRWDFCVGGFHGAGGERDGGGKRRGRGKKACFEQNCERVGLLW